MVVPGPDVRMGVRAILQATENFHRLPVAQRREIAQGLVKIGAAAADLAEASGQPAPNATPRVVPANYAQSMNAGDAFSGAAVDRIAPTTQRILNAVSFPRFVGELITGVFKAMNESNQQQLTSFVELIKNVAASTEGFADSNVSLGGARSWLAERFPGNFEVRGGDDEEGFDNPAEMSEEERREWQAEQDANTQLRLKPGASMPSEAALRTALSLGPRDSVPSGNPEQLVPFARASLARGRQEILASMVMMGLQRIVIDGGRLNASMKFHIDATSAAEDERGSRTNFQHESDAAVRAQFGPWGAAARMRNTIGYVSTERTATEEAINAELDLDSAVELVFRTDYVPLERLAGADEVERIQLNSLNPSGNREASTRPGASRASARRERSDQILQSLQPQISSPQPRPDIEVPGPQEAPTVPGVTAGSDTPQTAEPETPQTAESETPAPAESADTAGDGGAAESEQTESEPEGDPAASDESGAGQTEAA